MAHQVLKKNLSYHLKRIYSFRHIVEFCELVMSAEYLVEKSKNIDPEDSDLMSKYLKQSDEVFTELKEVIAAASVEVLIKKLFEILKTEFLPVDESNLRSLLLKTNNRDSLEYFEGLVNFFYHMFEIYWNVEQFYKGFDFVKDITEFKIYVSRCAYNHSMAILGLTFKIYIDKIEVSLEEKREWRYLFLKAAGDIRFSLTCGPGVSFLRLSFTLKMRSCVQFILDLFGECPEEFADVSTEFDKLVECKEFFDSLIDNLHIYSSDSDDSDQNKFDHGIPDFVSKLPSSHTWWNKLN